MNTTGSTSPLGETMEASTPVGGATPESENPSQTQTSPSKKFPVIEIFGPVIQGEGSQAGQQTMFIRFGGCDYRCQKCDSLHAVIPQAIQKHATYMTAHEILERLRQAREQTGVRWVTFSGGNPCMHKLDELVRDTIAEGFYINVETQGTLWQDWLNNVTMITISPKSMGMGEKFEAMKLRNFLSRTQMRRPIPICLKVVVFSSQDFEMALHIKGCIEDLVPSHLLACYLSLGNHYPPVLNDELELVENPFIAEARKRDLNNTPILPLRLLQDYRELSEEVLQDPRLKDFRFLPQLHVLVYGNESER